MNPAPHPAGVSRAQPGPGPVRPPGPEVVVTSFGYLHREHPPMAEIVVDVRAHCRVPATGTGADTEVWAAVLATPGAVRLVAGVVDAVVALLAVPRPPCAPVRVAIGCAAGLRRSVVLADSVTDRLLLAGHDATVQHLHLNRPGGAR